MGHDGGDGMPGEAHGPGEEPEPAELWITTGDAGSQGRPPWTGDADVGSPAAGEETPGRTPADAPNHPTRGGTGPARNRGAAGGPGRTRWIALAIGFAVLIAIVAVQHVTGGHPAASTTTTTTSASVTSSPTDTTSAPTSASSGPTSEPSVASQAGSVAVIGPSKLPSSAVSSASGTPLTEYQSRLLQQGMVVATAGVTGSNRASGHASTDTTSPTTTTVPTHVLPTTGSWQLVGYGTDGLVRYQPETGRVTITPVPRLNSNGPLSFVVTDSAAIIRPIDFVRGYLIPSGKAARPLSGLLARGGTRVLPGPDPGQVWVTSSTGTHMSLVLENADGHRTGTVVHVPDMLAAAGGAYDVRPDGAGYALIQGIGGFYDVRPSGVRLITHGAVLAVGPAALLVYECDAHARCALRVIDRATGKRRDLHLPHGMMPTGFGPTGSISPDGRFAALADYSGETPHVELLDLSTGAARTPDVELGQGVPGSAPLAFSPDSRYLLAVGASGKVTPIDTHTDKALAPLPLPPISVIAVRSGN